MPRFSFVLFFFFVILLLLNVFWLRMLCIIGTPRRYIQHFLRSYYFFEASCTYTHSFASLSLSSLLLDPRLSAVVSHSLPSSLISLLIPSPHTPPFPFPYCFQSSPFWLPFFPSAAPSRSPLAGVGAGAPLCGSPPVAWSRELCASGCDGRTAVKMTSGPPA